MLLILGRVRVLAALFSHSVLSPAALGRLLLLSRPGAPLRRWLGQLIVARNRYVTSSILPLPLRYVT